MGELHDLAVKHQTDKGETHLYMNNYEKYFASLRDKPITVLELGVAGGNSLRMWREYFSAGMTYGIDINPDCEQHGGVFIGSQTDTTFLQRVIDEIGIPDIIIDDGSHVGQDMIDSFKFLFPKMKSGGIYAVEDFACAYSTHYSGELESNGRTKAYNFFTDLAYDVDIAGRAMTGNAQYAIDHGMTDPPVPEYSRVLEAMHTHTSIRLFIHR